MTEIKDRGQSTAMQYEKWEAKRKSAPKIEDTRTQRVMHSPRTFFVCVVFCAALVIALVLQVTGIL
jgi:Flp pilus assembly protein TadB